MRSRPWLCFALRIGLPLALVLSASPARSSADGTWSSVAGNGPVARKGHTAIYDSNAMRMIVFGGEGVADTLFNDVWSLDLSCDVPVWTQLSPSGTPPVGREDHSAIYDPVGNRMIVFGGEHEATLYNDTWSLSLGASPTWTQLSPSGTVPCRRSGHSAIYDPNAQKMVVYGGLVPWGQFSTVETQGTFTLSLGANPAWQPYTCNEGADCVAINGHICTDRPSPRQYQSMIWDGANQRGVLFGGWYEDQAFSDSWKWVGTTWSSLTVSNDPPYPRENHRAIYDASGRHRMVVFGGDDGNSSVYNETWELTLPTSGTPQWNALSPAGTGPGARTFHTLVYDPVHDRAALFGGQDGGFNVVGGTWLLTFGSDNVPPATTSDLHIAGISGTNVKLQWSAPGDDGTACRATSYSVRKLAGNPITAANWSLATPLANPPTPGIPGTIETLWTGNLPKNVFWYFALRTTDDASNSSDVSNNDCIKFTNGVSYLCAGDGNSAALAVEESRPALAIERLAPNPARRGASVTFSIPAAGPTTLELLDVAGRVVATRDLGTLAAGSHVVDLAERAPLGAGFYFVRIRWQEQLIAKPMVVLD